MEILYELNEERIQKFIYYTELNNQKKNVKIMSIKNSSLPHILKINRLGLFTNDSQDGELEICDEVDDNEPCKFILKERCYVSGFIEKTKLEAVKSYMSDTNEKRFKLLKSGENVDITIYQKTTEELYTVFSNYNYDYIHSLIHTILSEYNQPSDYFGGGVKGLNLSLDKWEYVSFYDSKFGVLGDTENGLYNYLIKVLLNI